MSIVTIGERRDVDDNKFKSLVADFETAAGTMWLMATDMALAAFTHANKETNTHSPDRIKQAYGVIIKCDVSTVERAFVRACHQCTGISLSTDRETGAIVTKFSKEKFAEIKVSDIDPLAAIEAKGLKAYKQVTKKGSKKNPVTAKDMYHVLGNEVADTLSKIKELDPDNSLLNELVGVLTAAKTKLTAELDKLGATKKLAATLAPSKEEAAENEKAKQRAALEAQLAALNEAA